MQKLPTNVRGDSQDYVNNRAEMLRLVAELEDCVRRVQQGGDERSQQRHEDQGKLLVRHRIQRLLDPESPFL
jgi:acetyl-CoA carboxylase carboxyltransferase component